MLAIFLDIETTGLDARRHHVLEIAYRVIDVSSGNECGSYSTIVKQPAEAWEKKDPNSIGINGFNWEEVCLGKHPDVVGKEIIDQLTSLKVVRGEAVFVCQNPAFDRGFFAQLVDVYTQEKLNWPYHWLDFASMYWALRSKEALSDGRPFPIQINLSKNEIAKNYQLNPEAEPHRAMNGVDHLILCYKTVVGFVTKKGSLA